MPTERGSGSSEQGDNRESRDFGRTRRTGRSGGDPVERRLAELRNRKTENNAATNRRATRHRRG